MLTPEKNDIDVSILFEWGKPVNIILPDETTLTFYVRVVSDEEFNKARVYALRKTRELKEKLLDKTTDEHKAFMVDTDKLNKEELVNLILMLEMSSIYKQAEKEVNLPFPKEPEIDAPTSEWVEYQKQLDEYPEKLAKKISKKTEQLMKVRRKELSSMSKNKLEALYLEKVLDSVLSKSVEEEFIKACVFYGTFKDKEYKERVFKSIEQIDKLPTKIKEQFIDGYLSVDIPMERLKK